VATFQITVLRTTANQDLVEKYCAPGAVAPCPHFTEGQEFIAEYGRQPEGFCGWAWDDIQKACQILRQGGDFAGWSKDPNSIVRCCTDGIRPVVFDVKKIHE
jgi:uncharacterized repeat protein (TIGR04076 family)